MAFVSATSLKFKSSLKLPNNTSQASCRISNLRTITVGWNFRRNFPSLRTSGFRISCAALRETTQKVCEIVRKRLALAESELTPEIKFSALGADSLDIVEIVMSLEEEFGITVEEENSELITTVQEAAELIDKLIQKKGGD